MNIWLKCDLILPYKKYACELQKYPPSDGSDASLRREQKNVIILSYTLTIGSDRHIPSASLSASQHSNRYGR